jgi:anaerobic selenocysteine-containing dehydrogenase
MESIRLNSPMRRAADGSYEVVDWETAIREVSARMTAIRDEHGGDKILYYGGGGQGNYLGGAYVEANSVSFFEDLGVQMSVHSTLVSYLQRLVWVTTGNYGKMGTANAFVPFLSLSKASKGQADYVLPASSQFEKAEATFFNVEFPDNVFHLRV